MSGRLLAQQVAEHLGQQVVVDNRTGAGGTLGTELGAKAPPDGYTIVMGGTGTLAISPRLGRPLGYDPLTDFAPITLIATTPYVLVAHPSVPAKNGTRADRSRQSTAGQAQLRLGRQWQRAPSRGRDVSFARRYQRGAHPVQRQHAAKIDLIAGRVQLFFTGIPPVASEIKNGTLRALGVTSARRTPSLTEVPTIAESGVKGFDVSPWFGVPAPAKTSPAIVARLNEEMVKVLRDGGLRERLVREGVDVVGNSPAQFSAFLRKELDQWAQAVRESGAKVE